MKPGRAVLMVGGFIFVTVSVLDNLYVPAMLTIKDIPFHKMQGRIREIRPGRFPIMGGHGLVMRIYNRPADLERVCGTTRGCWRLDSANRACTMDTQDRLISKLRLTTRCIVAILYESNTDE